MNLEIKEGITDKQIDKLIEYSLNDESVAKFTSDKERFKNKESFFEWKNKGRKIYTLTNDGDLLGIIWLGKKGLPMGKYLENINFDKYKWTFAIRIYGEARGKGLGLDFMRKVIKKHGIWLECSADNLPAQALYKKFGFRLITEADENNKVILIY